MTQKTTELTLGNQKIDVETLSKEIRDSVAFFDRIGADMTALQSKIAQLQYEYNVWLIAANSMKSRILNDVEMWIKSTTPIVGDKTTSVAEQAGESDE